MMKTIRRGSVLVVVASVVSFSLVGACTGGGDPSASSDASIPRADGGGSSSSSSSASGGTTVDAGPVPLPAVLDETWVAICTTPLASKDPAQALRFWVEGTVMPPDGQLALKLTPLLGWSNGDSVTPANATAVNRRKASISLAGIVTGTTGLFTANFGKWEIEAAANSLSGRDFTLEDATLDGRYDGSTTAQGFCARLSAHMTQPYDYMFVGEDNICLFRKAAETDPIPDIPAEDFFCN